MRLIMTAILLLVMFNTASNNTIVGNMSDVKLKKDWEDLFESSDPQDEEYAMYQREEIKKLLSELDQFSYDASVFEYFPQKGFDGKKVLEHIQRIKLNYNTTTGNSLLDDWIHDLNWYITTVKQYILFKYLLTVEVPSVTLKDMIDGQVLLNKTNKVDYSNANVYRSYFNYICNTKGCPDYKLFLEKIKKDKLLSLEYKYCSFDDENTSKEKLLAFADDLVSLDIKYIVGYFRWRDSVIGDFYWAYKKIYEETKKERMILSKDDFDFFCHESISKLVQLYEEYHIEIYFPEFIEFYKKIECQRN